MRYLGSKLFFGIAFLVVGGEAAHAQMGPGPMGPGMGGPTAPSGEEKKEGVAEAAPKTPSLLPTTPALPPAKGRRKRYRLLELDGYFRVRTDWFKNFNLGFNDEPGLGGAPFPRALGCSSQMVGHPCDNSIGSANMRLRLEPTINVNEGTSVHVQADVFDNTNLGSTPTGIDLSGIYTGSTLPPLGAFGDTQSPPVKGVNSASDAIQVKRAWAEVAVPLGVIKAGRQPNQWGMGIYANAGGLDPVTGNYDYDADYGDSVDRVSFTAGIPGTPLRAMVATDWNWTGLASNQTSANVGNEEHPFDLDDSDDATSYVGVVSKIDTPQDFKDAQDRGDTIFDYGVYFQYKTQAWSDNLTNFKIGQPFNPSPTDTVDYYVPRSYTSYTTSLWGKLGIGHFTIESEIVGQFGAIERLNDYNITSHVDVAKVGGAGRFTWTGVDGKLRLGIENGFATGDQYDNTPQGNTNIAYANVLGAPGDKLLTQFFFNRAYRVDMIMWRFLFGAVTNAFYTKPFLEYDLTKGLTFKVSNVTSFALSPVATPGNSVMYGTEFDSDIGYNTSHVFTGISFGVLFPFGAMSHPEDTTGAGGPGFGYGTDPVTGTPNTGDGGTAYCIQARLVVAF
ncbi:MAG TPA: TIGR04551 family protein [Kofleriaceae bacterium]|nr:TIGR04551 family protein [Kofleriaceae bacterium]